MTTDSESNTENDVFSVISAPVNLEAVEEALKAEFPEARVYIYTSGYNGARTVHLKSDSTDFEGYPHETDGDGVDSDYFLNGMIPGDPDHAVKKAKSIFSRIIDQGMSVKYEVYNATGEVLAELP